MANLIAQSNVALAETLAHALHGLRPAPVPTIKLGRFMGYPQRSGDTTLADWLDDFFYLCSPVGSVGGWQDSGAARSPWWLCKRGGVVPSH